MNREGRMTPQTRVGLGRRASLQAIHAGHQLLALRCSLLPLWVQQALVIQHHPLDPVCVCACACEDSEGCYNGRVITIMSPQTSSDHDHVITSDLIPRPDFSTYLSSRSPNKAWGPGDTRWALMRWC